MVSAGRLLQVTGMGRAGDAVNHLLLPPTLHPPLHLKPLQCVLPPTSILAPENGFNITQMIKCKLQQHHPGTLICSFYPYSGLILHADTSGTIVFGVSLGLVWERVLSYLAYTLCTKPKAQPESQPWLGQPKSTKPQELSLLHG